MATDAAASFAGGTAAGGSTQAAETRDADSTFTSAAEEAKTPTCQLNDSFSRARVARLRDGLLLAQRSGSSQEVFSGHWRDSGKSSQGIGAADGEGRNRDGAEDAAAAPPACCPSCRLCRLSPEDVKAEALVAAAFCCCC